MQHEAATIAFAQLAEISQQKRQLTQRDKFLLLTGISACRVGWLDIAARCRELVLAHNPSHLIRRYDSLPDALRDEDFGPFQKQLDRFCTFEKAEHLLTEMGIAGLPESVSDNAGDYLRQLFNSASWETD